MKRKYAKITCFALAMLIVFQTSSYAMVQSDKQLSSVALRSMARIFMTYGRYEQAEVFADRAVSQAQNQADNPEELSLCLIDLATVYSFQNQLEAAEQLYCRGLEVQQSCLWEKHPAIAHTLRLLAGVYRREQQFELAQAAIAEGYDLMLNFQQADDKELIPFTLEMARILADQDQPDIARMYFQQAVEKLTETLGPEHLYTANIMAELAELDIKAGNFTSAGELLDKCLTVQERVFGSGPLTVPTLLSQARLYQQMGLSDQANEKICQAVFAAGKNGDIMAMAKVRQAGQTIIAQNTPASQPLAKVF